MKVLLAGESWSILSIHTKGFDHVDLGQYHEAAGPLIEALEKFDVEVVYLPNHTAQFHFPMELEALEAYDVIILSDIGSNNLLLHPDTQYRCKRLPNRLKLIKEFVKNGGGFMMCGGYMSYSGVNNRARYGMTPIADILPVNILNYDDRMENPDGIFPTIVDAKHPILTGIDNTTWPDFLGYNKTSMKPDSHLIATFGDDVFIASNEFGKGRAVAFTSDCVPHWGSPEFVQWKGYGVLFSNIMKWLSKEI